MSMIRHQLWNKEEGPGQLISINISHIAWITLHKDHAEIHFVNDNWLQIVRDKKIELLFTKHPPAHEQWVRSALLLLLRLVMQLRPVAPAETEDYYALAKAADPITLEELNNGTSK